MLPPRIARGEKDNNSAVTISATRSDTNNDRDRTWPIREPPVTTLGEAGRKPTLEIMKSSCVDQEVSYISRTRSRQDSTGSSTKAGAKRSNEEPDR